MITNIILIWCGLSIVTCFIIYPFFAISKRPEKRSKVMYSKPKLRIVK